MARLRSAPSTQNATTAAQTTRQALKEKTNTAQARAIVYENDGDADKLVKNARPKRGRARDAAPKEDEFVMAGGLGENTERQTLLPGGHPPTTDELAESDGQPPPPNANSTRRPPRKVKKAAQHESQSQNLQAVKKRAPAKDDKRGTTAKAPPSQPSGTSTDGTTALCAKSLDTRKSASSAHERSEFSLSPSPPPKGNLSAVKDTRMSIAQTESAMKPQITPAAETSIFALKNFKRRPRQPSMLQMVQRTASARPSAVTAQANEDPTVYNVHDDIEDDEEFAPDAEGTPLRATRAKAPLLLTATHVSNSKPELPTESSSVNRAKKRKSVDGDLSSSSLSTLKAKRQRLSSQQRLETSDAALLTSVPGGALPPSVSDRALLTSKPAQPPSSARQVTLPIDFDAENFDSEPSATSPTEPSSDAARADEEHPIALSPAERERTRPAQSVPLDDPEADQGFDIPNSTMAEPASSSPLPSPRTTRLQADIMAEPLTQASPQRNRGRAKNTRAKPLTTATLQALLPKRRQPLKPKTRVSEYDIESDSDHNDRHDTGDVEEADEPSGKSRRQTKTTQSKSKKPTIAAKSKSLRSKAQLANRKSSAPATRKPSVPPPLRKPSRTYSRAAATASDKENDGDAGLESLDEDDGFALPDTSLSMYEAEQSKELEEARKKFAEVDEWDMEFESMSIEEGRRSSQEWR